MYVNTCWTSLKGEDLTLSFFNEISLAKIPFSKSGRKGSNYYHILEQSNQVYQYKFGVANWLFFSLSFTIQFITIMPVSETEITNLKRKVDRYKEVLGNTKSYREKWKTELKKHISDQLTALAEATGLTVEIEERSGIQNLEAIALSLGTEVSGLREPVGNDLLRDLIKQNGNLVYQQLFNGKILVLINPPYIEKYGEPQPPKTLGIYRPEELKDPYFIQHLEQFLSDVTAWEDYDDDLPDTNQRIGFKMNFEN